MGNRKIVKAFFELAQTWQTTSFPLKDTAKNTPLTRIRHSMALSTDTDNTLQMAPFTSPKTTKTVSEFFLFSDRVPHMVENTM